MMDITNKKLKSLLVSPGFLTREQFLEAEKESKDKGISLWESLLEKGFITDEQLGKLIAAEFGYKFVDLQRVAINEKVLGIIPELVAKMQKVIIYEKTKDGLKVAMANPDNFEMVDWLERKTGEKISVYYATPEDIKRALKHYKKELKKEFEEIIASRIKEAGKEGMKGDDIPIAKLVDVLIEYGYENRASDLHIEPLGEKVQVRFRIDGILHNVLMLPKDIHELIVSRIKVLSRLRTDDHFSAQDGRFEVKFGKERFDIRVSIIPVTEGENVVMRLLSERARRFSLEALGFSKQDYRKVKEAIKKAYGMVLATGPTGSGKTTTIYAILKTINSTKVNICSIEDPVEYDIEGVSQVQVNPKTNLTFSKGLRSIVRQDPDIIMIGEIRDEETASIAINSAMTGHLVLSTMHANNASINLVRLIDMHIEPFLVASSLNIVIAQKLVRKICTRCRESYGLSKKEAEDSNLPKTIISRLFKEKSRIRIYKGKGCKTCVGTGYSRRIGVFEVLEVDEKIKGLVMEKADAGEIEKQAIKNGMTTMFQDGIEKVFAGVTTIEEILRVTSE